MRKGQLGTATGPAAEQPRDASEAGPSDGAPAVGMSKGELKAYAKGVRARMEKHRRYPLAALRLGLQGTVKIKLSIDRAGRLAHDPEIVRSSGHAVLDEEALRVVTAAAPYAALPAQANKEVVVLVVPIEFEIDEP